VYSKDLTTDAFWTVAKAFSVIAAICGSFGILTLVTSLKFLYERVDPGRKIKKLHHLVVPAAIFLMFQEFHRR
jgi:hypothetical protein